MNKKGMTTIELITSFALASVIFIILFNITLALKDMYLSSGLKTDMLIDQANLSESMNSVINSNNIVNKIAFISNNNQYAEYTFETIDGNYTLIVDQVNGNISFNNYTYKLAKNMSIKNDNDKYSSQSSIDMGDYVHFVGNTSRNNNTISSNLLIIDIPIYNTLMDDNLGVKIIYQLNGTTINIEEPQY